MNNDVLGSNTVRPSLKDEFCVWSSAGKAALEYDVSEEYLLPDYLPDIKKILLVKAKIRENEPIIDDGKAEYGGSVTFFVVYQGDDGRVKSVSQSYPYTNYISLDSIFDDSYIEAQTEVKNRSARAVSPRKLLLKAKVTTEISVYNKLCVSPRLVGSSGIEDEFSLERSVDNIDCVNFFKITENDIRVSEDIEYKGSSPISELVWYDIDVCMTECKYTDGRLGIKGNGRLYCLLACSYDGENITYDYIEKNLPIEFSSDAKLPIDSCMCYGNITVSAIECGVGVDSRGENRVIETDFVCRADITGVVNEKTLFTNDVFSTAWAYENTYKPVNTERAVKCACVNFSCDGKSPELSAENGELDKIFMSNLESEIEAFEVVGDKGVFTGQCLVKASLYDKTGGFTLTDFSFPVRYEMPLGEIGEARALIQCRVLDSRVTFDGKSINANAELELTYAVFENITANTVSQISIDRNTAANERNDKTMILYYPEAGETLWSVAKKYGVARASIESANNRKLTDVLPRVIVIPVK
ncbi:MAG: DUF3794 domain-containing protein [Ruminococcaceae bacterium]|nr:DUF3794 domain-containing protein [Oscillospiraceae bacterium]